MKPYLSIIIPYYNSASTIRALLASIAASKKAPAFEVIIVDDGSKNGIATPPPLAGARDDKRWLKVNLRLLTLKHNRGPAVARNRGAKVARGQFLVFLDSDVELFPDTLYELAKVFKDDPDVVALTGVWVKEQRSMAFFPNFKALRDWSYWINERDKSGYYFLFSTRIAAIKKAVFDRLGGFDESYNAALVEDIELTYRIARRYAIIFAPRVRVRHEFEGFFPIAKKYFWRSFYWTRLYQSRKKFDPVATTLSEAVTTLSGVGVVGLSCFTILSYLSDLSYLSNLSGVGLAAVLALHLFFVRRFLMFLYQEKGLLFAIRGFFTGLALYLFIFAGALWGRLRHMGT